SSACEAARSQSFAGVSRSDAGGAGRRRGNRARAVTLVDARLCRAILGRQRMRMGNPAIGLARESRSGRVGMPSVDCLRRVPIKRTPRVKQLEVLFDVPPAQTSERRWRVSLPLEERDWNLGLIVGPSGCGKSTLARELFGDHPEPTWP